MVDFNILKLEVCVKSHDEEEPEIDGIEVDRQQCSSRAGQLQLVEQGEEAQNIATFDIKKDKGGRQEDQEKSVLTYEKCTVLIIYLKSEVDFERL